MVRLLAIVLMASATCGIEPIPPFGCLDGQAICVCDEDGCSWYWVCP